MENKIKQAEMILSVIPKNKKVYLAFSGGKDSQCIYHRERYKVMNPNFTDAEKVFDWWVYEKMEGVKK